MATPALFFIGFENVHNAFPREDIQAPLMLVTPWDYEQRIEVLVQNNSHLPATSEMF